MPKQASPQAYISQILNGGINTLAPSIINENQVYYALNVVSMPDGLTPVKNYQLVQSGQYDYIYPVTINGQNHLLVFSGNIITDLNSGVSYTASQPFANISVANWQNEEALIMDINNGLISFDGFNFNLVDDSIRGYSMVSFMGSIFYIAPTKLGIVWSAPGTYNNFSTQAGAGSVFISDQYLGAGLKQLLTIGVQLYAIGSEAIYNVSFLTPFGTITSYPMISLITNQTQNQYGVLLGSQPLVINRHGVMALAQNVQYLTTTLLKASWDVKAATTGIYDGLYPYLLVLANYSSPDQYLPQGTYLFLFMNNAWNILQFDIIPSFISPPDANGIVYCIANGNIYSLFTGTYWDTGYFYLKLPNPSFFVGEGAIPTKIAIHTQQNLPIAITCDNWEMATNTIVYYGSRVSSNYEMTNLWTRQGEPVPFNYHVYSWSEVQWISGNYLTNNPWIQQNQSVGFIYDIYSLSEAQWVAHFLYEWMYYSPVGSYALPTKIQWSINPHVGSYIRFISYKIEYDYAGL